MTGHGTAVAGCISVHIVTYCVACRVTEPTTLQDSTNCSGLNVTPIHSAQPNNTGTEAAALCEEAAVAMGLSARGHNVVGVVHGKDRKMFGWGHIILR
jgi:hypothetical protein